MPGGKILACNLPFRITGEFRPITLVNHMKNLLPLVLTALFVSAAPADVRHAVPMELVNKAQIRGWRISGFYQTSQ